MWQQLVDSLKESVFQKNFGKTRYEQAIPEVGRLPLLKLLLHKWYNIPFCKPRVKASLVLQLQRECICAQYKHKPSENIITKTEVRPERYKVSREFAWGVPLMYRADCNIHYHIIHCMYTILQDSCQDENKWISCSVMNTMCGNNTM